MNAVLQPLANSPRLPAYVQELEQLLAGERERRRRFYDEVTDQFKAEFINGQVIMHTPARRIHTMVVKHLVNLLHNHVCRHQLGEVLFEKALISLARNDYEPDVLFYGRAKAVAFTPTQVRHPASDFIAEVLPDATAALDRGVKFEDYAAHGVVEYWLVDTDSGSIEQYRLEGETYRLHLHARAGDRIASLVVPGFDIPVTAVFDEAANQQTLLTLLGMT